MAARTGRWTPGGALAATLIALCACGRPTGDFGRAEPSFLHDSILPVAGDWVAAPLRKEQVSTFPLTDDEIELRDRAWSFVRAPHVRDWWLDTLVEGERTRILPLLGSAPSQARAQIPEFALPVFAAAYDRTRYHRYLLKDGRISTETLWTRLVDDARADTELVPPFCEVAARVRRADVERLGALTRQGNTAQTLRDGATARIHDNEETISWVWDALGYRAASYRYAIDQFQVEAPSAQLFVANRTYDTLVFSKCQGAPPIRTVVQGGSPRQSRLMAAHDPFDDPVPQK